MRRPIAALVCAGAASAALCAQAPPARRIALDGPHLRVESGELRALVADTAARSSTFHALLDRLDDSDLIVYVRMRHFISSRIDGRIGFVSGAVATAAGPRVLVIELACPRRADAQQATLAHELRHAIEIADAPWVDGPAALAEYYRAIGETADALARGAAFETAAARETALRVKRELTSALKLAHED